MTTPSARVRGCLAAGDFTGADAACREAIAAAPADHRLHGLHAHVLNRAGRAAEAFEAAERSLAVDPAFAPSLLEQAAAARALARFDAMEAALTRLLAVRPDFAEAWVDLASCRQSLGRPREAAEAARQALRLKPDRVEALRALATALMAAKTEYNEWVATYAKLVELDPRPESWLDLALALREGFYYENSRVVLDQAIVQFPDHLPLRWGRFQNPPQPFAASEAARTAFVEEWRQGFADFEARLDPNRPDAMVCPLMATNFYLHYAGEAFVEEQRRYGALVHRIATAARPQTPAPKSIAAPGTRRRVGFVSAYFREHTIGKLFVPLIERLDPDLFDVHVFKLNAVTDAVTDRLKSHVPGFVAMSERSSDWPDVLAAARLDVIVFTDIGMHPLAQSLAALRNAPVQCVTWGHPVTTGLPTIDYFLTSDAMEREGGEVDYTETLVRLPNLGVAYEPPDVVPERPPSFTPNPLPDPVDIFVAQTVYKLTPEHDDVYARLCEAVPGARIHFAPHMHRHVRDALAARMRGAFTARGLDFDRHVVMHPSVPLAQFLGLAAACDLNLDSMGWSGGNTTLEILWQDVPTLTLPGALMRARHTMAMLRMIGLEELIATDVDDFVDRAVALCRDPARRKALAATIGERKHRLYRDEAAIEGWNRFLATVEPRRTL